MAAWGFELIDVEKRYGAVEALKALDLGAALGQVTAVHGAPGTGKTTAIRLLAGLERPDVGAALVAGHEISRARGAEKQRLQRRMAVVFAQGPGEAHGLFAQATVLENVEFSMRTAGRVPRCRLEQVALQELERFGLAHAAQARPDDLSPGGRKCLALARAVALGAPLVLVDGLETGLERSPGLPGICGLVRRECHEHGTTWLVTSRRRDVAQAVGDVVHELGYPSASRAVIRR